MSSPTVGHAPAGAGTMAGTTRDSDALQDVATGLWWMWLVTGVLWVAASLVILQFNHASITTIGVIVGCMFLFAGFQQLAAAFVAPRLRWLFALFGLLFLACGVVALVDPANTFAGVADVLGFLFLVVGVWWTVEAFASRSENPIWWLGLISGVLMVILAFWTSGQFFVQRAYTLLIFAGIWALMHGITDIAKAFAVRRVRDRL
jgi:uncharacterized membrane protein HdeD (DUF308 family)